jgi:fibronectin-binding autotransporter adhesin
MGRSVAIGTDTRATNVMRRNRAKRFLILSAAAAASLLIPRTTNADTLTWTGAASNGLWDTTSTNWYDLNTSSATTYSDGNAVAFYDNTGGTSATALGISVLTGGGADTGVDPTSVTFADVGSSTSGYYTFTDGAGDTTGISGSASVTLNAGYGGTVTFSSANSYTGGTFVNGGTLHAGSGDLPTTATITLGGGTFQSASGGGGTFVSTQNFLAAAGTSSNFQATATGNNVIIAGSISSGSGATATGTVLSLLGGETFSAGNLNSFTGTFELGSFGSGTVRLNYDATNSVDAGSATAIFDLGASSATLEAYNGGGSGTGAFPNAIPLGALEGTSTTSSLAGASHSSSTVYAIGGLGLTTTFAGVIKGGTENACALYIVGGALTLTGDNTYPGVSGQAGTTIANGAVYANNATSSTGTAGVLVEGNSGIGNGYGILGGSGLIASTTNGVTVNTTTSGITLFSQGGHLAPGPSGAGASTGTLTITGGLILNDYSNLDFTLNGASTSSGNDLVSTNNGALTLSGNSLVLVNFRFNNSGPAAGSTYNLINYGTGTLSYVAGGSNASVSGWTATGVPAGDAATFTTPGNGQVDVTFTAVPEPATLSLLSMAGFALLGRRKQKE